MSSYTRFSLKNFISTGLLLAIMVFTLVPAFASDAAEGEGGEEKFNPGEMIMHHIKDDHVWEFWHGKGGTIYLPVIVRNDQTGWDMFWSSKFFDEKHHHVPYTTASGATYELHHGKLHATVNGQEVSVLDFSVTKNVASLFFSVALILLLMLTVARGYKKRGVGAPKGIQSLIEPIIIYVRDEIAKPVIGPKYQKFVPYLLTLFFFIWINNLLGLLPGAANLSGNIAVTACLAVFTLLIVLFNGNKNYWGHIFTPPGVPVAMYIIIVPVEIIGIFTKPFSLMLRLFVSITAGHIVILSLISLIFIFQSYAIGFVSSVFVLFLDIIELLVATIQAYVFTLFTAMYISQAVEEHHHEHDEEHHGSADAAVA